MRKLTRKEKWILIIVAFILGVLLMTTADTIIWWISRLWGGTQ